MDKIIMWVSFGKCGNEMSVWEGRAREHCRGVGGVWMECRWM